MSTTASGSISLAAEYAAATLADCAAFQSWCGASSAANARGRIHLEALPPPANKEEFTVDELHAHRPYAILSTSSFGYRYESRSNDSFDFSRRGRIELYFEEDVLAEISGQNAEVMLRFYNNIGAILDQLCDRAGQAGFLAFTEIEMGAAAYRTHQNQYETEGDMIALSVTLGWEQ